jgi:TadE-like protein
VLVLLLMLFLALVSVGLWAYARTILTSAAAEAARAAAAYGTAPDLATATAAAIVGDGPAGSTRDALSCTASADGLLVTVRCTMPAPGVVGLLDGVLPEIEVTGHAARETVE